MRTFVFIMMLFPLNLMAQLQDSIPIDLEKFTIDKTIGKIIFRFIDSITGINIISTIEDRLVEMTKH